MASDPAPFFANLFYSIMNVYVEHKNDCMKENVISAQKFCQKFRFMDDLININNEHLKKNIGNIYPAELKLKKKTKLLKSLFFRFKY